MSLLSQLKESKNKLRGTTTSVRTPGGEIFNETRSASGEVITNKIGFGVGFVIDLKPDLQVTTVTPGLLMGSQDVTQDIKLLQINKVTDILSIGVQVDTFDEFNYHFFNALDLPEFNLIDVFENCCALIDRIKSKEGVVYVHCNAGVSRSASVVIAYLMKVERFSFIKAYNYLRSLRPSICKL
uniref:Dual specificity protein phosphatase 19 n=1 Tax=Clastoptera arizonana TaxID=38151 RepID=A0A1B6C576_9HEMI